MNSRWVGRRTEYVAAAAGVALALAGCSGGSSGSTASSSTSTPPAVASSTATPPPSTQASTPATPTEATSSLPSGVDQVVTVSVANGKVTGPGGRVKIKKGSTVQLVVTSDIADEIHLHGYDKHTDVQKGGTAALTFKATITGVFEVELEAKKLRLLQLQVA